VTPRSYQAPAAFVGSFYLFLIAWTCIALLFLVAKAGRSEIGDILQSIMIIGVLCFTWYFSLGIFYRIRLEADGRILLTGARRAITLQPRDIEAIEGPFLPIGFIRFKSGRERSYLLCWVKNADLLAILKRIGEINSGIHFKTK
jgi:energy-coupling factor transporter transmembrane protein EcfT